MIVQAQTTLPDSILAKVGKTTKDSSYVIRLNQLATDYLKYNPSLSRKIATHVTEIAPEIKFKRGYARALTVIGNSYWYEGVFEFAQNYYLLAARQYQAINDSIGLGQAYNNLGEVHKRLGDYQKSLEYLLASVTFKRSDVETSAITYYNIGELYIYLNKLDKAVEYIDKSLSIALKKNDKRVIAYDYRGMGLIKFKQAQYESALEYLTRAEILWKELGEIRSLIQTYQDLADVYRTLKLFDKAERYLTISTEMSYLIKAPDLLVNNYFRLSQLDSAKGEFKDALLNMYQYNLLRDSVYNLNKTEQIAKLSALYESETKERENEQLRNEKEFRESQLKLQKQIIVAISLGLLLTLLMAWLLFKQRHKILSVNKQLQEKNQEISTQKLAIEMQATALVKLNEELQELNKNLEQRIDARTQQLLHQNQKLTEYTFVNAHKLRAPVTSILGLIHLMEHNDKNEQEVILNHLKTCSEQLDLITRQISRSLESGIIEES
jgi:tetratricopeptide (TPR) repeat protein